MNGALQLALLLSMLGAAPDEWTGDSEPVFVSDTRDAYAAANMALAAPAMTVSATPADPWLSEDKFRHAAASWAAMVFTFAAVRSVADDNDVALGVALPVTAGFGVAKEVVDRRAGGPFSFRDLAADALGAGAAWLFLREVH